MPAALWRKQRTGDLSTEETALLVYAFGRDYAGAADTRPRFALVAAGDDVLERAAVAVAAHGLRAYDAVQLASALAARDADPRCFTLACFDARLRRAGAASGFALLPG